MLGAMAFAEDQQVSHEEQPWAFRLTVVMHLLVAVYMAYRASIATGVLAS
jgi:hypothetical protein